MANSMQDPASQRALGAPRHAAAPTSGPEPMDGFELLVNEHRKAWSLLERALHTDDAAKRQEQWRLIRRLLLSHERAEALELYSALDGYAAARDIVEQHRRDEGLLESAASEVDATDPASDAWLERLRALMTLVEAHVLQEENAYFPRARQLLGEETTRELHERLVSAQRGVVHTLP